MDLHHFAPWPAGCGEAEIVHSVNDREKAGSMSETATETQAEMDNSERGKALRKAYGEATTALRENHRQEFDRLYQERAKAHGVDYTPKPTPEQKAEQQLQELLAAHPHLAEKVRGEGQVKEFTTNA